jgi:preprotein translocase subunit SecF
MFNIVQNRFRYFFISIFLIIISVIALLTLGLKSSIEFSGGSELTLSFTQPPTVNALRTELANLGHSESIIQTTGTGDYIIRLRTLAGGREEATALEASLATKLGELKEKEFTSTEPLVAQQTARTSLYGVGLAALAIMLYIAWAWRKVPHPFRYGACSVIALLHDLVITAGIYAILAYFLKWETDLMFIAGVLAILGFTDNNTVIIFDRIRENRLRSHRADFETVVNNSVMETITRSFNTSFTVIVTLLAVILFVGSNVQNFAVVFLIGIVVGLFDSTFIAPALLVVWDKHEWSRFLPWLKRPTAVVE